MTGLRTLLMLETTVLSVFEDLVQAHLILMPLLMSADVKIKNLHMWHILCSKHKYTGGIHLILVAQYFIKQVALHRPANSVDLALAVRSCKLFGQTVHIIPTYTHV